MLIEDKPYKLSRFCKVFTKGDVVALYHSLLVEVVYLKDIFYRELTEIPTCINLANLRARHKGEGDFLDKALHTLVEKNIIVPIDDNEIGIIESIREELLGKPTVEMMYLLITDQCNLRCGYCFLETHTPENFKPNKMTIPNALRAVDFFMEMAERFGSKKENAVKVIHIYGGEPLTNWPALKSVVGRINYLRGVNKTAEKVKLVTITNGTLINSDIADFFKRNNMSIGISLDGHPQTAGKYRKYVDGSNSFREALRGYRYLTKSGVEVGISCTLVPESLENPQKMLDYLLNEIGIDGNISFNILHHNPTIPISENYLRDASDFIIYAFEVFRKHGIYEERMMRKITPFVESKIMLYDCGGCGQQLAVSPEGKVGTCHDCLRGDKHIAASIFGDGFNPRDNAVFLEWSKRSPFNMPECYDCEVIALCGGGCPSDAEIESGSIWGLDTRFCIHSKTVLKWMIWDQYSHIA